MKAKVSQAAPGKTQYGQLCCKHCNEPPLGTTGLCPKHTIKE